MDNNRREIPLARARGGYDKRGKDTRQQILKPAIQGVRPEITSRQAAALVRDVTGGKTANWMTTQAEGGIFGQARPSPFFRDPGTLTGHMVSDWWIFPPNGTPEIGSVATPPIPIAQNRHSGLDWNLTMFPLFSSWPGVTDVVLGVSEISSVNATQKIELLDALGNVLKSAVQTYAENVDIEFFTGGGGGADQSTDFSQATGPITFDTNGPISVFYGVRLTCDSSVGGTVSPTHFFFGAPTVALLLFEGQIIR